MGRDGIKIAVTVALALATLSGYSFWRYVQEEERLIREIDGRLYAAATSVPFVLADGFHERAVEEDSISPEEDRRNIENLSRLNQRLKTKFLYTVMRDRKGVYRLTSSSALDGELRLGQEVRYFTAYPDVSELLTLCFERAASPDNDFRSRSQDYRALYVPVFSDRWGSYRSVFIPIRTAGGNLYAVGADIDITYVKGLLRQHTLRTVLEFFLFLLIILPIVFLYVSVLKRKHQELLHVNRLYLDQSKLSNTDPLTQINNRLKLDEDLHQAYEHFQRSHSPFGLVMIDIDNFKEINDRHGHHVGDMALQRFADLLSRHSRTTDSFGRWGGEEFMIIYRNTDLEGAYHLAERLRQSIESCWIEGVGGISASFGVAQTIPGQSLSQLLREADKALYSAKRAGKNRTVKAPLFPLSQIPEA